MSVLVADRKESRWEALTYSVELHDLLIDFMQRGFGVKDVNNFVRLRYAHGKDKTEEFAKYNYLMLNYKTSINRLAGLLSNNLRAANTIYPTSMDEFNQRRGYLNTAIANCEQIVNELQRVVKIFEVDINVYKKYIDAIYREIGLIKKWRQRDNKIKSYVR